MIFNSSNIRIIFLALLLSFTSCNDWLDEQPIDELVQDNFWQTKEDLEAVLMAAYAQFAQIDDRLFIYGEIRGDMLEMRTPTNAQRQIQEGNLDPENTYCNWTTFYKIINYCNLVIEFGELTKNRDQTFTSYQLNAYLSEAMFLRSLSYFYLIRIFKEVPFITQSAKTDNQDFNVPKSDDTTIINNIIEDIENALITAPNEHKDIRNTIGRATKDAMSALLADIFLWTFDYEKCIEYCDKIITQNKYVLIPGIQWYTIFYPGNSMESIFEFQHDQGLQQPNRIYQLTWNNRRFIASIFSREILSSNITGDFIRSEGSFRETDYVIWKYAGTSSDGRSLRPSGEQRSANWIVYRYADILFMKAEALGQLGRYNEAVSLVNQIRQRAFLGPVSAPGNKDGFEDLVLDERAREFAFEGKRWFDLLRMGRRNNYARKSDLIDKIIQVVPVAQRQVYQAKLADPYGWYFPIHINEIEANKNLVQNPYYEFY